MRFIHISMNSRTLNEFLGLFKPLNEKEKSYPGHQADSGPKPLPPWTVGPRCEAGHNGWGSPQCWPNLVASHLMPAEAARWSAAKGVVTMHPHRMVVHVLAVRRWG
jgi:hypothetical protein